jgi:hypothetical protein
VDWEFLAVDKVNEGEPMLWNHNYLCPRNYRSLFDNFAPGHEQNRHLTWVELLKGSRLRTAVLVLYPLGEEITLSEYQNNQGPRVEIDYPAFYPGALPGWF